MKKLALTLIAALALSGTAMAQDEKQEKRDRAPRDNKEMVEHRTKQMTEKYGLNEEQSQKLLDLNTRFSEKMRPMGGQRRMDGNRPQMRQRPQAPQGDSLRADRGRRPQGRFGGANREEMRKNMEAYEAELKTILTEDQYKAYQEDQKNRPQGRGNRGQRRQ